MFNSVQKFIGLDKLTVHVKMNRTNELFKYIAESSHSVPIRPNQKGRGSSANREALELASQSKEINMRLTQAIELITQLNTYVNGNNVLGENDQNIQALTVQLQNELAFIDNQINALQARSDRNVQVKSMAQSLRKSLADVTIDFKNIVQKRSDELQKVSQRRRNIGFVSTAATSYSTVYNQDEVEFDVSNVQMMQQQNLEERLDMVRNVETSISQISEMFMRLAEMIAAQDYDVLRIDQNTQEALDNFNKGTTELEKYYNKVKSNKMLMFKIFAALFVFALIFILIV